MTEAIFTFKSNDSQSKIFDVEVDENYVEFVYGDYFGIGGDVNEGIKQDLKEAREAGHPFSFTITRAEAEHLRDILTEALGDDGEGDPEDITEAYLRAVRVALNDGDAQMLTALANFAALGSLSAAL